MTEDQLARMIKIAMIMAVLTGLGTAYWFHGHQRYVEGKAEVQALWDKDKAERKAAGDKQAADTLRDNQEKQNALNHTQAALRDTRGNLNIALNRLRDLPYLPGGESLPVAGGGCSAVPGVADHSGGIDIGIEKRIGRCEDSGSEPCYTSREFFDQAIRDAADRGLTRQWAIGQKIKFTERIAK